MNYSGNVPIVARPWRKDGVLSQRVGDSLVLLDPAGGEYYSLEGVGVRVWELCDGTRLTDEVVAAIQQEYDAPLATVQADVVALLTELANEKLVVEGR